MQSLSENSRFEPVKIYSTQYSPPDVSNSSPIIFIHGLCSSNRTWKTVKREISDKTKRKVYAIDLRNHGESEWPKEYSIKLFVDDLEHFMETERISKAVLVGHSLGGRIAIAFAFRKPEMVEKLVVEDIALVDTEKSLENAKKTGDILLPLKKAISFLPPTLSELEAKKKFLTFISSQFPELCSNVSSSALALPFHKDSSGSFVWDMDVEGIVKVQQNMHLVAIDLSNNPVYNGEMILLRGGKSIFLTKEDVEIFYKHIPKFKEHFVEGGFHILHVEFPEKYIEIVTNFIGQ